MMSNLSRDNIEDIYPMSDIEMGMVYHTLKNPQDSVYHNQIVSQHIVKGFDPVLLKKALLLLIQKHQILRTCFDMYGGDEPVQILLRSLPPDIEHYDISRQSMDEQEDFVKGKAAEDRQNRFDFDNKIGQPLWRLKTFDLGNDNICFMWVCHHAILDGWSAASLMTELSQAYWKLKSDPDFVPARLKSSYKDFVIEQLVMKENPAVPAYWREELAGYKHFEFPPDCRSAGAKEESRGPETRKLFTMNLGQERLEKLKRAAVRYDSGLKHLCFAAYVYMFAVLGCETDVTVGLVTNNRPGSEDGEKILGCFLNTVPVRVKVPTSGKWASYVRQVDRKLKELARYDRLSLFEIARFTGEKVQEENPFFDTLFNYVDFFVYEDARLQEAGESPGEQSAGRLAVASFGSTNTMFDFTISATHGGFVLGIKYVTSRLTDKCVKRCGGYFVDILDKIAGEAHIHLPDYPLAAKETIRLQAAYHIEQMAGELPVLNLPLDYPRPGEQSFEGSVSTFKIGEDETRALKFLVLEEEITLFMLLFAIYNVFLSKLSGQEDIIVGAPAAGRRHASLQGSAGVFVNTLALRNFIPPDQPFRGFLGEVKKRVLKAYENRDYPFEDLVEQAAGDRDLRRSPLFSALFSLQVEEKEEIEIPGLGLDSNGYQEQISKFDLALTGSESGETISFSMQYSSKLFKEETIARFITFFKNLVASVAADPGQKISGLSVLPDEEKQRVLYEFNDTYTDYPRDKTIHGLFMEQVAQHADRTAVVGVGYRIGDRAGEEQVSYRELDRRSRPLALLLKEKGVGPDRIVGMIMDRSIDILVGILGILKAGGAYLPLDPDFPEARKRYMLNDTKASVLVTTGDLLEEGEVPGDWPGDVICLERVAPAAHDVTKRESSQTGLSHESKSSINNSPEGSAPVPGSANLAYVIYTSGTTGIPKGTLTTHANVIRVVRETNYIDLTPRDRLLQLSNYSFDGSVFDIYGALLNGAALVLIKKEDVPAIDRLSRRIIRQAVTVFFITTSLFNMLVDLAIESFAHIRNVQTGGEQMSAAHVKRAAAYAGKGRITNVYGPTETTVYASYYFVDQVDENVLTIPIGSPLANTRLYILDKRLHPVPIGVNGEMYIGGDGVARGYLNQPELTDEKFILVTRAGDRCGSENNRKFCSNFFNPAARGADKGFGLEVPSPTSNFQLIYKTGDLARWLPDGNVEFIGRIDHQVKIRGFRIEPGEIENRLLDHPLVKEAVVLSHSHEGEASEKYLCAYIVAGSEQEPGAAVLRDYLSRKMPAYMVPAHFIFLKKIPLTANGKVNRKILEERNREMKSAGTTAGYEPPGNETEKIIAGIWCEVLKIDKVGVLDNFFDVGGHSLNVVKVNSRLRQVFKTDISITDMFRFPSIREMAGYLTRGDAGEFVSDKDVDESADLLEEAANALFSDVAEQAAPAAHDDTKRVSSQKKSSQENKISTKNNID